MKLNLIVELGIASQLTLGGDGKVIEYIRPSGQYR